MKMFLFRTLIFCALLTLGSTGAHAQYSWKVTLDQKDDSTSSYLPLQLACNGNHCTAGVYVQRSLQSLYAFFRSDDGGNSWHQQWAAPYYTTTPGYIFVLAMQQIDSLNVVAVGDSGHIFRTFDGGVTWSSQTCPIAPTTASVLGVHFHDPMNGIIALGAFPATTIDGGLHWTLGPFTGLGSFNCHCYGPGKYAVFNGNTGVIYHTSNSWSTMDSTPPIPNASNLFLDLRWSEWTDGDTIIGYGFDSSTSGFIVRTTNGGASWYSPKLANGYAVTCMSGITDDTLFSGRGNFAFNSLLFSSDLGQTLSSDTVPVISQGSFFPFQVVNSVVRPAPGVVLAAVQQSGTLLAPGLIIRRTLAFASVSVPAPNTIGVAHVYPDPSEESIIVDFDYRLVPVQVLDVLGRVVMRVAMPPEGPLMLDISTLPKGIYYMIDDHERAKFIKE